MKVFGRGLFGGGLLFDQQAFFFNVYFPDEILPRAKFQGFPHILVRKIICSLGPSRLKLNSILFSPAKLLA